MTTERRSTTTVSAIQGGPARERASRRSRALLLGAALAAATLAPAALAQEEAVGDPTAKKLDRSAATEAFGRADADASGGLEPAEFAEELRRTYDTNRDETLDEQEYGNAIGALDRIAMVERADDAEEPQPGEDVFLSSAESAFGRFDENGDGQLDPAEFNAAAFQVVDADASDMLTPDEIDVLAHWFEASALPDDLDLNGDGRVSAEEYTEVMVTGE